MRQGDASEEFDRFSEISIPSFFIKGEVGSRDNFDMLLKIGKKYIKIMNISRVFVT